MSSSRRTFEECATRFGPMQEIMSKRKELETFLRRYIEFYNSFGNKLVQNIFVEKSLSSGHNVCTKRMFISQKYLSHGVSHYL